MIPLLLQPVLQLPDDLLRVLQVVEALRMAMSLGILAVLDQSQKKRTVLQMGLTYKNARFLIPQSVLIANSISMSVFSLAEEAVIKNEAERSTTRGVSALWTAANLGCSNIVRGVKLSVKIFSLDSPHSLLGLHASASPLVGLPSHDELA